jgi:aminopeptidase
VWCAKSVWPGNRGFSRIRSNLRAPRALGNGFPFLVEDEERERANVSAQHIDFMIGSSELAVDGVTVDGERVPVLRNLAWQL